VHVSNSLQDGYKTFLEVKLKHWPSRMEIAAKQSNATKPLDAFDLQSLSKQYRTTECTECTR